MRRLPGLMLLAAFSISLFFSPAECADYGSASDFTLQDTNNETVTLGAYKDKQAVLLLFWTTWCPYCRDELRQLKDMRGEPANDGLEILAVDVGESSNKVNNVTKKYLLNYKVLLDQDKSVARSFGVSGVPTYVLINNKGSIVFKDNSFPQEYKSLIAE